jgi:hypothetical protein
MQHGKENSISFNNWYRIGLFNLLLVSSVGLLLRFKMAASLPWVNHKYFLHGHSHFAFSGWVSLVLMTAIIQQIYQHNTDKPTSIFRGLLWLQLITAYGMLISFPFQGYGVVSITFSTLSILVSYVFVWTVWKKCTAITWGSNTAALSIRASLVFLVISSLGTFWLAFLMVTQAGTQSFFFSALYFYLHFQYNGWFFFAIVGLWLTMLPPGVFSSSNGLHKGIGWFIAACVPAVALSALWMKVPLGVYAISIVAVFMQFGSVFQVWKTIREYIPKFSLLLSGTQKVLLSISAFAFLFRISLQGLSTIPALSKFGFAYRPVVIAYLHLILLGTVTLFLFAWFIYKSVWAIRQKTAHIAILIFIVGFLFTEGMLLAQGLGYIGWTSIPYTNQTLLAAALLMFSGLLMLNISARTRDKK